MTDVPVLYLTLLDDNRIYIISSNLSSFIQLKSRGKLVINYTSITMNNGDEYHVSETPEQILAQL